MFNLQNGYSALIIRIKKRGQSTQGRILTPVQTDELLNIDLCFSDVTKHNKWIVINIISCIYIFWTILKFIVHVTEVKPKSFNLTFDLNKIKCLANSFKQNSIVVWLIILKTLIHLLCEVCTSIQCDERSGLRHTKRNGTWISK